MKNHILHSLITLCVTSLVLASTTIALAEYKPPRNQRPPNRRTTITGSRGECGINTETSLKLLAPQKHVGQTASIRPTFAWFVADFNPLPMKFRLYEYDLNQEPQLLQEFSIQSQYGIMTLSLPEDKPALEIGKRYLWQVAILCDLEKPANDLVAMAEIDVIEMLTPPLFIDNTSANVDVLAEAGLWYDALGEALQLGQKDLIYELLKDLALLETTEQTTPSTPE